MKSIISMQKKLIVGFILLALMLVGAGYYLLYGMKTINGNLNVNKMKMVDKLYSYTVYSDFYYRATKYDDEGNKKAEFSELQPIKTSIGYDLENEKAELILTPNTSTSEKIILSGKNDNDLSREIEMFNSFQKTFGKIVATQDEDYIKNSFNHTKDTLASLYGIDKELDLKKADDFYHEIKDLPIANMKVKYFQLDAINKNLRGEMKVAPKDKWQPNILEWNFGENDRIYLQYITKVKNNDLEEYLKKLKKKKKTIIKLVKINNNKSENMFLKIEKNKNKITAYNMDTNGYLYALIFETNNPNAFKKYIDDYLKIAYGIYFVDVKGFNNWFAKEQKDRTKSVANKVNVLLCNEYLNKQLGYRLVDFFHIAKSNNNGEIYSYENIKEFCSFDKDQSTPISTKKVVFDRYISKNNDIFSKEKINILNNSMRSKALLFEAKDKLSTLLSDGQNKLRELCPNGKIECVQNLVNNNYESVGNSKQGRVEYQKCISCHGEKADKKALGASQVIAGWDSDKIVNILKGYRNESYGGALKGVMLDQVANMSDEDIENVASYISTLK